MIPYTLKIVWFALSLSGLLGCWAVLLSVSRVARCSWGPILYCIGCTVLEGVFCLGIIWRMDPFLMPKGFCTAQTVLAGLANFFVTGVVMSISVGTAQTIFKPKTWGHDSKPFLLWRNIYLIPLLVLPVVGSIVYISMLVKYDAAQPSEDLHCDATHPLWVRFFSYAGAPLLLALPCLYLSSKSIIRAVKTNRHLRRSRPSQGSSHPRDIPHAQNASTPQSQPPHASHLTRKLLTRIPREFQSHPRRIPSKLASLASCPSLGSVTEGQPSIPSPVSSSFPAFADPSDPQIPLPPNKEKPANTNYPPVSQDSRGQQRQESRGSTSSVNNDKISVLEWREESSTPQVTSQIRFDKVDGGDGDHHSDVESSNAPTAFDGISHKTTKPQPPSLPPIIWRMVLFQLAFSITQILTCISTLIDVISHHSRPTSFGTQHVGLLLVCWIPILVFGHLHSVRRNLMFWRPAN